MCNCFMDSSFLFVLTFMCWFLTFSRWITNSLLLVHLLLLFLDHVLLFFLITKLKTHPKLISEHKLIPKNHAQNLIMVDKLNHRLQLVSRKGGWVIKGKRVKFGCMLLWRNLWTSLGKMIILLFSMFISLKCLLI